MYVYILLTVSRVLRGLGAFPRPLCYLMYAPATQAGLKMIFIFWGVAIVIFSDHNAISVFGVFFSKSFNRFNLAIC